MDKLSGFLLNLTLSKQRGSYDPLLNAEFHSEVLFIGPKAKKPFRFVPLLISVSASFHTVHPGYALAQQHHTPGTTGLD